MTTQSDNEILAELVRIKGTSFGAYLHRHAQGWSSPGQRYQDIFRDIVAGEESIVRHASEMMDKRGGIPRSSSFPTRFAASNDQAMATLAAEWLRYQQEDITSLKLLLQSNSGSPEVRSLIQNAISQSTSDRGSGRGPGIDFHAI